MPGLHTQRRTCLTTELPPILCYQGSPQVLASKCVHSLTRSAPSPLHSSPSRTRSTPLVSSGYALHTPPSLHRPPYTALPTPLSLRRPPHLAPLAQVVPPGVLNVVTGYGAEAGEALATSKGVHKLGFTGSTATGTHILKCAADSLIPTTMELGGKSPNIFFSSVCDKDDEFFDKAVEGAVLFALNQGEVCTCQSRLLVQEDIYDKFMERVVARTEAITTGDPLDPSTMMGAQVSSAQHDKIVDYLEVGKKEGAEVLTGGSASNVVDGGFYIKPTIFKGTNDMQVRKRKRDRDRSGGDGGLCSVCCALACC